MKKNNKGFSLVELIIVIAIMAILAGAIAPALIRYIDKSRKSNDVSACKTINTTIETALGNEKIYELLTSNGAIISIKAKETMAEFTVPTEKSTGQAPTSGNVGPTGSPIAVYYQGSQWSNSFDGVNAAGLFYEEVRNSLNSKTPKINYKKNAAEPKSTTLPKPDGFYVYVSQSGKISVFVAKIQNTSKSKISTDGDKKIDDKANCVFSILPEAVDYYN